MDVLRPVSYDLADYLSMLRRHWWLVVVLVATGLAGGLAAAHTQAKVYESATSVLVTPTGTGAGNPAGGRTSGPINLDTEAQLVVSTDIATAAQKLLKVGTPPDQLAADVAVTVPPNTTVLVITYSAPTPAAAQAGSHAFAIAYLQNRQATAQAEVTAQIQALDAKVKQYSADLSQLSGRLATMHSGDPDKADLNSQIATLTNQVNTLTGRENDLSTTQVTAGKIINDAQLPTDPSRPSVPLFLASGGMLGLLLGVALALVRERTDPKVRRAVDVWRRDDVPLLCLLPARLRPRLDAPYPAREPAGRRFDRLRNEVLASLAAQPVGAASSQRSSAEDHRVIVVTAARPGVAADLVAGNLAGALARGGAPTVLVRADLTGAAAPTLLGVSGGPGLSEVLCGTATLADAVRTTEGDPRLRVLPPGAAGGTGLLQSPALREVLDRLRATGGYLVIEAPSTASSADAQSLARLADAAILAVELRRTQHAEILDAAEQLRRVGTPLLGAVVFPRLRKRIRPAAPTDRPPARHVVAVAEANR
jgi:Mrp family chromosome partitioning ATPase/capsular polysaccharide biosynthesis protein